LSPEGAAAQFQARSLDDPGLRVFLESNGIVGEWPRKTWDLRDLTLVAFYYHPDLALARAQLGTVQAGEKTAGERPNPSVSFTPGYDAQIPGAPSPWILPVTFDLPIETAGKRRYRVAEARDLSDSAYWKWVGTVWQTRSKVRDAWLALAVAERTQTLLAEEESAQSNVVRLLEGQVSAGAAAEFEVTQARVALDTTRLSREDAQRRQAQARAEMAMALGLPVAALTDARFADDALESLPEILTEPEVRQAALINRSDVRGALADFAASQSALQLAIAGQYPDLHLGPGYSWNSGSAGDNQWQLGATMTLPVLNQNRGAIAEAEAKRREEAAHFQAVQAQAAGEIDVALAGFAGARQSAHTADALLDSLNQRLSSVRAMQKSGDADPLTVAGAEVEFTSGALARLDALEKAQQALGQLEDAAQSPLTLSEAEIQGARASQSPALSTNDR
jgi:outer membrane protein TolC